jgi:hypothetical protein
MPVGIVVLIRGMSGFLHLNKMIHENYAGQINDVRSFKIRMKNYNKELIPWYFDT